MLQEFAEQVEKTAKAYVWDIHTALPGKIVSFDPETCAASVQPSGKFVAPDSSELDYPVLSEVPLVFPYSQTSGVGAAFPVVPGDSCLIVVSETALDEWRTGAESEAPLRFDLTSALAVPGLLSIGNETVQKAVRENAVVISAKDVEVVVSEGKARVKTDGAELTVSGENVTVRGNLTVSGNVTVSGDVTARGVSLRTHTHSGAHGETSSAH